MKSSKYSYYKLSNNKNIFKIPFLNASLSPLFYKARLIYEDVNSKKKSDFPKDDKK